MNRSRWLTVAVAVVVVALAVFWWRARHATEAPKFRTATVEQGVVESVVSATGTVRPVVQVEVGSQVSGTVAALNADYNSRVHRGQVLCQLESSSFRARATQAEAAVARADAALLDARRQYKRAQELVAQDYVSQADVEAAEVQVRQREADLKQANAQLEVARVDLANTTIRAPIDGVVIARSIDLGQTVAASLQAPKLFVIANDLQRMQVETRIDEADIGIIHAGLPTTFTVDAFPDRTFEGEVEQVRLEPITEQNVVTYTTVIGARNPDGKLRPGMTANVSVLVDKREDVIKVPNAALRFKPPADPKAKRGGGAEREGAGGARASEAGAAGAAAGGAPAAGRAGADGAMRRPAGADAGAGGGMRRPRGAGERGQRAAGERAGAAGAAGVTGAASEPPAYKPGTVYVMRDGKPVPVKVRTGISDGAFTEVRSDELKPGDTIIVGLDLSARGNLTPPPGMGGPMMGGRPGGGGGAGGRR